MGGSPGVASKFFRVGGQPVPAEQSKQFSGSRERRISAPGGDAAAGEAREIKPSNRTSWPCRSSITGKITILALSSARWA